MSARKNISVTRSYQVAPDVCVRALLTLLKSNVNKKTAERSPGPGGFDHVRSNQDAHTAAKTSIPQ